MLDPKSRISGYKPEDVIILDTETTGIGKEDEIIQLSGIDGYGREVINIYLKPERKVSWPEAERVNHISPMMVSNANTISSIRTQLQNFLNSYKCIVGYNIKFDIRMLNQSALNVSHMAVIDVMPMYVKHYGTYKNGKLTAKLVEAAEHYGYNYDAHDSLEDVRATLVVLENLMRENLCQ